VGAERSVRAPGLIDTASDTMSRHHSHHSLDSVLMTMKT
jgi:hypothetical protein